jgi:hypothetical protein
MAAVNVDVGGIADGLFGLIDKLFTTDEERQSAKLRYLELVQAGELAQIGVNAEEAKHESKFVSGWRPFIGWVCGAAFAYTFVLQPLFVFMAWLVAAFFGVMLPVEMLPTLSLGEMMPVLLGMLGLGGLRSYEKFTGTNTNR